MRMRGYFHAADLARPDAAPQQHCRRGIESQRFVKGHFNAGQLVDICKGHFLLRQLQRLRPQRFLQGRIRRQVHQQMAEPGTGGVKAAKNRNDK